MTKSYNNGTRICTIRVAAAAMSLFAIQLVGCVAIGPMTIDQKRIDYVAEGRVYAARQGNTETGISFPPLTEVHSGASKPDNAFVTISYSNHWFWIDDRDIFSKAMFQFLMTLFSFTERGESERMALVITVPVTP